MARSVNRVTLLGNVGSDVDVRTVASGKKVAKFTLATSYGKGDSEKTSWHRCTAWDRTAEIVEQYVKKGDRIYLEGSIEYSRTEDDKGTIRYWTDIVVRELVMLSGGNQEAPARTETPASPFDDDFDDLPL